MEWFGGLKKVKKQNEMEWVKWYKQTWGRKQSGRLKKITEHILFLLKKLQIEHLGLDHYVY